ncbi:MAG: flagellar hook-associated protein FlgK [Bacillota bacterium]
MFYGLEIAKTGLFLSRQGLELTGHNIANANTEGYTRQRISTSSIAPAFEMSRFGVLKNSSIGGGVDINQIEQVRNAFIDRELRREYCSLGESTTRTDALEYIEKLFDETSDSSFASTFADFFNSLQELSTDTTSKELRTNVRQNALAMTETLNDYYQQLLEVQKSMNDEMAVAANRINDLMSSISEYNKQIFSYELGGERANDLRDKQNLLLDELAGFVNIQYSENDRGTINVSVEGVELIDHTTVTRLEAVADQTGVATGASGFYSIYYEGTTDEFLYSGGSLYGNLKMRDGSDVNDFGIPRIIENLNQLARSLAREFNAVHETGYTMPHDSTASQDGIDFFAVPAGGYDDITAENLTLSDDILDNVFNIATSSNPIDTTAGDTQQGNNEVALLLVELASRNDIPDVSNFEGFLKSAISEIAVESSHQNTILNSRSAIVTNLENKRESISGVSIDEEMTEMMKWQHSYAAASRMITAIDEMLDVVVNKMGMVGR